MLYAKNSYKNFLLNTSHYRYEAQKNCPIVFKVNEDDLKTYDANFSRIVEFLANEFDVTASSRVKSNEHVEKLLYFVGDTRLNNKKTISVYFARRLSDPEIFKKIDEFFLKQSTSRLKKLILTSSCNILS